MQARLSHSLTLLWCIYRWVEAVGMGPRYFVPPTHKCSCQAPTVLAGRQPSWSQLHQPLFVYAGLCFLQQLWQLLLLLWFAYRHSWLTRCRVVGRCMRKRESQRPEWQRCRRRSAESRRSVIHRQAGQSRPRRARADCEWGHACRMRCSPRVATVLLEHLRSLSPQAF